ncbi:hypothetical protein IT575_01550 [bacterium]|nr:hypothetical protein [bacterium]
MAGRRTGAAGSADAASEGAASRSAAGRLSERGIITAVTAGGIGAAADPRLLLGPGDDAAVLRLGPLDSGRRLNASDTVITTDLLVEGVHFDLRYITLADAAFKALAVNLSDCAAMGARPAYALGQLGVPAGASQAQIDALLEGLAELQHFSAQQGCPLQLIGGDTVAAPQWIIGFTVLGELSGAAAALTRSGARPGHGIWLSAGLGRAQTGLCVLSGSVASGRSNRPAPADFPRACAALRRPLPGLALGLWLQREGLASACLDTSDSLSESLLLLAQASGAGLLLDLSAPQLEPEVEAFLLWLASRRRGPGEEKAALNLPGALDPAGRPRAYASRADWLLACAEDYGLLFSAPESASLRLLREAPGRLLRIGTVVDSAEGCHYRAEDGKLYPLQRSGYEHF